MNITAWFFLVLIVQQFFMSSPLVFKILGLVPSFAASGYIWQFATYMFVHSSGLFHILFNMIVLWMFGSELERLWGSRFFLIYYLTCGIGAAVIYAGVLLGIFIFSESTVSPFLNVPVVGSSGAIFGLLAAYGVIFKDRIILFMLIFPMKARTFTYILAGVEILSLLSEGFGSPVANLAHLGGLVSGFLFLMIWKNWTNIMRSFRKKERGRGLHIVKENGRQKIWH